MDIYDVGGRLVRTLKDGIMDAGHHEVVWDGRNNACNNVSSGVYFYKLKAGDSIELNRKMILLR